MSAWGSPYRERESRANRCHKTCFSFLQMGLDSIFFARIDENDRQKRLKEKNMETLWKTSDDLGRWIFNLTVFSAPRILHGRFLKQNLLQSKLQSSLCHNASFSWSLLTIALSNLELRNFQFFGSCDIIRIRIKKHLNNHTFRQENIYRRVSEGLQPAQGVLLWYILRRWTFNCGLFATVFFPTFCLPYSYLQLYGECFFLFFCVYLCLSFVFIFTHIYSFRFPGRQAINRVQHGSSND